MIELLKIIKGMYDLVCVPHFSFTELSKDSIRTRGRLTYTNLLSTATSLSLRLKEIYQPRDAHMEQFI